MRFSSWWSIDCVGFWLALLLALLKYHTAPSELPAIERSPPNGRLTVTLTGYCLGGYLDGWIPVMISHLFFEAQSRDTMTMRLFESCTYRC